jgi:hypothetical protein
MKALCLIPFLLASACVGILAPLGATQSTLDTTATASTSVADTAFSSSIKNRPPTFVYQRPTEKIKLRNYFFDAFGPYPIAGAAIVASVNQEQRTPPEWGEGANAYGRRFGSAFAIAGITTTTRYALAKVFREDTIYYRCECKGALHRFGHALISTITSRRGEDGHSNLSFPAIVAPYAGTMTAVYAWYPQRYGAKDALRTGNYALLLFAGQNVALEFIYGGPHTLFSKLHRPAFSGTDGGGNSSH